MSKTRATSVVLVVLALLGVLAACGQDSTGESSTERGSTGLGTTEGSPDASPSTSPSRGATDGPEQGPTVARTWESGASGDGVADGSLGSWRGRDVEIAGTWNDSSDAQVHQWSLTPGEEYGDWQGDVDVAIGAIFKDQGESWADAAAGAYDDRWATALDALASAWAGHSGTTYIRFAHEFNGTWFPWSVTASETTDFKAAWARFRALQLKAMPTAKLVFCPNTFTQDADNFDWRDAFPGADLVDVEAVDVYNQYPYVATAAEFEDVITKVDASGAPQGLEQHRQFAESQGLPFAIPEWSNNADLGDGAVYMGQFHRWLSQHGGDGPGEVLYEILFNVGEFGGSKFQLFPDDRQPKASAAYRSLW